MAEFHTAFNIALALLFFPFLKPYAALMRRLLPARLNRADPSRPMHLDRAAVETPVGAAAREALRLADVLEAMPQGVRDAFEKGDRRRHSETWRRPGTAETSVPHLDVVRDLKRVNAHLVEAAAYPILQAQGELLPTRLRAEE